MNLPSTLAGLLSEVSDGTTLLRCFDRALEIELEKLVSNFELIFYLSFFSINLIIVCLCEVQSSSLPKECKTHDKNSFFLPQTNIFRKIL